MGEIGEYDGKVSSCIDIVTKLCEKYPPIKVAGILNNRYDMDMSHVHRCISIYLGGLGTMDDKYIEKYPESNLSSLGTTLMEYNSAVKDVIALADLVMKVKELPQYNLDSFSIVYQYDEAYKLDLAETFDRMRIVDIALQYGTLQSNFALYNGNTEMIRRKISTDIGKIPKRYVEFIPKAMDKEGVVMAQWNGKDFKVYCDKFVFDCSEDDLGNIGTYVDEAISTFGIDGERISFAYQSNTKASLVTSVDNWNAVVLEDLIINNSALARITSVTNGVLDEDINEEMLRKNRSIVMYITHPRTRCVFRYNSGTLKVSIASLSIDDTAIVVSVAVIWRLLKKYRKNFASAYEKYSLHAQKGPNSVANTKRSSKIDDLRRRLPELFANNYTRECHNLPVMLDTEQEAEEYRKLGRLVIKYPLDGKYSKWYTSPTDDLYVGLKINRLSNKDKFKYIVNCYSSNHYNSPNRETYTYYQGSDGAKKEPAASLITLKILSPGRRGPLPIAMTVEHNLEGYTRLGTGGPFIDCIAHALGIDPKKFLRLVRKGAKNGLLNVVRQEIWSKSNEEILDEIADVDNLNGIEYYRLFEEVYEHNILLVEIGHRGKYAVTIPPCKGKYIWEPCKGKYIIVVKNEKKLYEENLVSYELVTKRKKMVFGKDDPLVSAIVSFKLVHTIRSDIGANDIKEQYITEHGKCNIVVTKDGMTKCNSRPLYRPILDVEAVRERSTMYKYLGNIPLSSTAKHLYFPDNVSFVDWWNKQ